MIHQHMSEADFKRRSLLFSAGKDAGEGFAVGAEGDTLIGAILAEGDTVESVYMRGHGDEHVRMAVALTSVYGLRYMVMDVGGPFAVWLGKGE